MQATKVSGGSTSGSRWASHRHRKSITDRKHRTTNENMDAGPANAISNPASAGPIARATLVEIAFNATAAGTISRGIKVNVTAIQADMLKALPVPRTKVSISNDQT